MLFEGFSGPRGLSQFEANQRNISSHGHQWWQHVHVHASVRLAA